MASRCVGSDTPEKLLHTMLYTIGLNFALRGGEELTDLNCVCLIPFRRTAILVLINAPGLVFAEWIVSSHKRFFGTVIDISTACLSSHHFPLYNLETSFRESVISS